MANQTDLLYDIKGYSNENKAFKASAIAGNIALLGGIYYGVKSKRKAGYYFLLVLFIVPVIAHITAFSVMKPE